MTKDTMNNKLILILGVTASGKSRLAFDLARQTDAEIISIDSMKVYKRMDIGTAKPPKDCQKLVKYHLIDVAEPSESFSVGRFLELANSAIEQTHSANKPVVAVGGTAMYIKSLLYGLFEGPGNDEKIRLKLKEQIEQQGSQKLHQKLSEVDSMAAGMIHPNDAKRIIRALEVYELTGKPISGFQNQFDAEKPLENWKIIGLKRQKSDANSRINTRVKKIIEDGLVDEVKSLLAEDKPLSQQARCAIGYAEIIQHLQGHLSLDDAIENIKVNTRRFAKAQRTWFKTFKNVTWVDIDENEPSEDMLKRTISLLKSD